MSFFEVGDGLFIFVLWFYIVIFEEFVVGGNSFRKYFLWERYDIIDICGNRDFVVIFRVV